MVHCNDSRFTIHAMIYARGIVYMRYVLLQQDTSKWHLFHEVPETWKLHGELEVCDV
jgi:hypothetical protein